MKKHRSALNLLFLFTFLLVTLFINYFHTEKYLEGFPDSKTDSGTPGPNNKSDDCPACHFLKSTSTTSQINFSQLPPPLINSWLETVYSFTYTSYTIVVRSSRSPPTA